MKVALRMRPKCVSNKRPVSLGTSEAPNAPTYREASILVPTKERKAAIELVAQICNQFSAEVPPPQEFMEEVC